MSRRRFVIKSLGLVGVVGTGGSLLAACGGSSSESSSDGGSDIDYPSDLAADACGDVSGLSSEQQERREQMVNQLNYVAESPEEGKFCANCQLYVQPSEGASCGGCQLFPGPAHPNGYCTSWVPKAT